MFLVCTGKYSFNYIPHLFTSPLNVVEEFVTEGKAVQDGNMNKTRQQQSQNVEKNITINLIKNER